MGDGLARLELGDGFERTGISEGPERQPFTKEFPSPFRGPFTDPVTERQRRRRQAERDSVRRRIRTAELKHTTSGLCPGTVQANLVILPSSDAGDFRAFCERNPRPCPLIEQTEPGEFVARLSASTADIRTDAPLYRLYRHGELVGESVDLLSHWREDLVTFLLGCSFTFERALVAAGIPLRHQEEGKVVPMYVTNLACTPAGRFEGPMVVSMRPVHESLVGSAIDVTARYPLAHGAPIHVGNPAGLGIRALGEPDFGEPVTMKRGEVPLFWACGVTPQAVARRAKPEIMMTHAPGHMFLTDLDEPGIESYN